MRTVETDDLDYFVEVKTGVRKTGFPSQRRIKTTPCDLYRAERILTMH